MYNVYMPSLSLVLPDLSAQPNNPTNKSQRKHLQKDFEPCLQKSLRSITVLIFYLILHGHHKPNTFHCMMSPGWQEIFHSTVWQARSQLLMQGFSYVDHYMLLIPSCDYFCMWLLPFCCLHHLPSMFIFIFTVYTLNFKNNPILIFVF